MTEILLHITTRAAWEAAVAELANAYTADSLRSEGFIHCSTPQQVVGVANALYRGQTELVLLCIDPERVQAPIAYEDCYDSGQVFPHIYGPLHVAAVTRIIDFPPQADGAFVLPPQLTTKQR